MLVDMNESGLSGLSVDDQLNLLKSILSSCTEYSIIASDMNGIIVTWNAGASKIYGYNSEEAVGRHVSFLYTPEDIDLGRVEQILQTVKQEGVWSGQMQRLRKNGEQFNALLTITLRRDNNGNPVGYTAITRDMTDIQNVLDLYNRLRHTEKLLVAKNLELTKTAHAASEANKLKSEFLANISHELRTPLNSIIGFTNLMHQGLVDPASPNYKEFLQDVIDSGNQLLHLVNDLLDLASIESGKINFHTEKINFRKIIKKCNTTFAQMMANKEITFIIEIEEDSLGEVYADPAKVMQILNNYISNAVKFTPKGGRITVRIYGDQHQHFHIEVEDTGMGIFPDDLNKLFIQFNQMHGHLHGSGLGLALTKQLVEAQGGRVEAQSTFGKGSKFSAILPFIPLTRAERKKLEKIPSKEEISKILVVEDKTLANHLIMNSLVEAGYTVIKSPHSATAISRNKIIQFDAVIVNLLQPNDDTQKMLKELRALRQETHDTPFLILGITTQQPIEVGYIIQDFLFKSDNYVKDLLQALTAADVLPKEKQCVLIIDDDNAALNTVTKILHQNDYSYFIAKDKISALEILKTQCPNIIIMDPFMKSLDGFELLRNNFFSEQSPATPVIILTHRTVDETKINQLQSSIKSIIFQKPNS